jgi:4-hydroxythreonine-4-phosphate dehydrogenase
VATLPMAVTMGDPAGIGGDVILEAWRQRREESPFFVIDDPARLEALALRLGANIPVTVITGPEGAASAFDQALPVLPQPLTRPAVPGHPDPANAPSIIASIDRAIELAASGRASAIVTAPIHKKSLLEAGFAHAGHTDYLADRLGLSTPPVMMLACTALKVVPVTVHVPLREALTQLNRGMIVTKATIAAQALRQDFGIAAPRLAVAGVNPHAGEEGALGDEEIEIVTPAIADLVAAGIDAFGPLAADTLFAPHARERYDVAICMYHDQALIPLKTIAFDIAGQGSADPSSMIAALRLAADMAARRGVSGEDGARAG